MNEESMRHYLDDRRDGWDHNHIVEDSDKGIAAVAGGEAPVHSNALSPPLEDVKSDAEAVADEDPGTKFKAAALAVTATEIMQHDAAAAKAESTETPAPGEPEPHTFKAAALAVDATEGLKAEE